MLILRQNLSNFVPPRFKTPQPVLPYLPHYTALAWVNTKRALTILTSIRTGALSQLSLESEKLERCAKLYGSLSLWLWTFFFEGLELIKF